MYLLFKYLCPKELERQQVENFDAWTAIYAHKTTDFEFSVANNIIVKERFRYFIKVLEWAQFYSEITDYRTAKDIGIDRLERNEILCNIPPYEIRFMQRAKNDKQWREFIRGMNYDCILVLFGSTSVLGTGIKAQKRVVAVHHLYTPL